MRDKLLALVTAFTAADDGQMTLSRNGPDTHPDPGKTSWNDAVNWWIELTFGRGYFSGANILYTGNWNTARPGGSYGYTKASRDLPVEEAVDLFLSNAIPDWAKP